MRKKRFFLVGLHHYIPQFYVESISLIQALLLNQIFLATLSSRFVLVLSILGQIFGFSRSLSDCKTAKYSIVSVFEVFE